MFRYVSEEMSIQRKESKRRAVPPSCSPYILGISRPKLLTMSRVWWRFSKFLYCPESAERARRPPLRSASTARTGLKVLGFRLHSYTTPNSWYKAHFGFQGLSTWNSTSLLGVGAMADSAITVGIGLYGSP